MIVAAYIDATGVVTDTILVEELSGHDGAVLCPEWVGIGMHIDTPQPSVAVAIPVPGSVTMRQARLALLGAGLLDAVTQAIAAIPDDTQRKAAEIEWEYASTVDRGSAFTQQLAAGLGLSSEELDSLFMQAAGL